MSRTVKFDVNDLRVILEPFLAESGWLKPGERVLQIDFRARQKPHACPDGTIVSVPDRLSAVLIRVGKGKFEDVDDGPESSDLKGKKLR